MLWGLGYALLLWLVGPAGLFPFLSGAMPEMGMLDAARAHFPELFAYFFCFGVPLGLTMGIRGSLRPQPGLAPFNWPRALVVGGLAGIVGGWAFGKWMAQVDFFPLIAGLVNSDSRMVGVTLHYLFAIIIGASFGLLFQRDVRGYGSSLSWGLAYGLFWWFLGPLTIMPLWQGKPVDWSYERGSALFGSLVGHAIYGLLVGLVYAAIDRLWLSFFVDTDPIHREVEGPGTRTLQSLGWGAVASLAGGLLFSLIMVAIGFLPTGGRTGRRRVAGAGFCGPSGHQRPDWHELWAAVPVRSAQPGVGGSLGPGLWPGLVVYRPVDPAAHLAGRHR